MVCVCLCVCVCVCMCVCARVYKCVCLPIGGQTRKAYSYLDANATAPMNSNQVSVTSRSHLSAQLQALRGHGMRRGALGM